MLKIIVVIENTTADKIVEVPGWPGGGDLIGPGVNEVLGNEAGQALQGGMATAELIDNRGNVYKQVMSPGRSDATLPAQIGASPPSGDHALPPGKSKEFELIFPPPLDAIEYLRIELSPVGFGGEAPLRFQVPKSEIAHP